MKEKNRKPTPKRLRTARKRGQVAKSKEIAATAVVIGLFGYIWIFFDYFLARTSQMILLPVSFYGIPFNQAYVECLKSLFKEMMVIIIPFALAAMTIAVLAYVLQFGVIFAVEPIKPDFNKINPVEGFKRLFSLNNLLELIKSTLKITVIGTIVFLVVRDNMQHLMVLPRYNIETILEVLGSILKELALYIASVLFIVAVLDYFFQKQLYLRKLKMSIDDIKREFREREGDPQLKKQRRHFHRELITEDMASKIRNASVIITSSNTLAVAVYYEYGKVKLPVILLKGQDLMAERMLELARGLNKPLFQDPFLTRRLFEKGKEDKYIPRDLIEPIAMVLRSFVL